MVDKQCFEMLGVSLIICRNKKCQWLAVKESRNRGWWLPGGRVDPPENFYEAAVREVREEAGVDVKIKGILRVEYETTKKSNYQRLKLIFYAEPVDEMQIPKSKPDKESEEARWCSIEDIIALGKGSPGLRGSELYDWPSYIEKGGAIYPLSCLVQEGSKMKVIPQSHTFTMTKVQSPGIVVGSSLTQEKAYQEFLKVVKANHESWFWNKEMEGKVNSIKDEKGNNAFQIAMLAKNNTFAKSCLMLLNKESLLSCNADSENVLMTALSCWPEKGMIRNVLMKAINFLNVEELKMLVNSKHKSGKSAGAMLKDIQEKKLADFYTEFPQLKQLVK